MSDFLSKKANAMLIASKLREAGHEVLFAGGCVRDVLLGSSPKDIDIATSATPRELLSLFPDSDSIGAHFGVILVRSGGESYEVATFRKDGTYSDNRRPDAVEFSSAQEDALRRDFTINGLFQNPFTEEILDYVEGLHDIKLGLIKAIGIPQQRFKEDALRLLRAVRFACVTGFAIEPITAQALRENAPLLAHISQERISQEFFKIMLSPHRALGLDLLMETGLMHYIIPEMYALIGCEQPPEWHPEGDVYTHTKIMLEMLDSHASLSLVLATLLHDIGKPATYFWEKKTQRIRFNGHDLVGRTMTNVVLQRMKCPNILIEQVTEMVGSHMKFMHVQEMREAKLRRFMARPTFSEELELHRIDCASSNGFVDNYEFLHQKLSEFSTKPLLPMPLVTGYDLLSLGISAGPIFKKILEAVQTEQLERKLETKEQALDYIRQFLHNTAQVK